MGNELRKEAKIKNFISYVTPFPQGSRINATDAGTVCSWRASLKQQPFPHLLPAEETI